VETFLCREPKVLAHVLAISIGLVVKAVGESGGYGMLIGSHASKAEREAFAQKLRRRPENYIAQPTIQLSTRPPVSSMAESRRGTSTSDPSSCTESETTVRPAL